MTVIGTVRGGQIVLPEGVALPEGAEVAINVRDVSSASTSESPKAAERLTHREKLLALAGTVEGLPPDLSANLDHYLYGVPKR